MCSISSLKWFYRSEFLRIQLLPSLSLREYVLYCSSSQGNSGNHEIIHALSVECVIKIWEGRNYTDNLRVAVRLNCIGAWGLKCIFNWETALEKSLLQSIYQYWNLLIGFSKMKQKSLLQFYNFIVLQCKLCSHNQLEYFIIDIWEHKTWFENIL